MPPRIRIPVGVAVSGGPRAGQPTGPSAGSWILRNGLASPNPQHPGDGTFGLTSWSRPIYSLDVPLLSGAICSGVSRCPPPSRLRLMGGGLARCRGRFQRIQYALFGGPGRIVVEFLCTCNRQWRHFDAVRFQSQVKPLAAWFRRLFQMKRSLVPRPDRAGFTPGSGTGGFRYRAAGFRKNLA